MGDVNFLGCVKFGCVISLLFHCCHFRPSLILNLPGLAIYLHFYLLVAWIVLAVLVARWTSFFTTIWSGATANRTLLRLGFLGLGINTALLIYLTVYLPRVKGLVDSSAWSVYCPRVIPAMAGVAVGTTLILIRATWPVWGFLSPLILGTEFMGALMILHFVPSYPLSNGC